MGQAAGGQIDVAGDQGAPSTASLTVAADILSRRAAKLGVKVAGMCWVITVAGQLAGKADMMVSSASTPPVEAADGQDVVGAGAIVRRTLIGPGPGRLCGLAAADARAGRGLHLEGQFGEGLGGGDARARVCRRRRPRPFPGPAG